MKQRVDVSLPCLLVEWYLSVRWSRATGVTFLTLGAQKKPQEKGSGSRMKVTEKEGERVKGQ